MLIQGVDVHRGDYVVVETGRGVKSGKVEHTMSSIRSEFGKTIILDEGRSAKMLSIDETLIKSIRHMTTKEQTIFKLKS
jgi:hypothetical protein